MQTSHPQKSEPNSIQHIIQKDSVLRTIAEKTNLTQSGLEILTRILPSDLISHCNVVNIQKKIITLSTDSAIWATHLRYYHQTILQAFQGYAIFGPIHSLRLRIIPAQQQKSKADHSLKMSAKVSNTIQTSAESIKHPQLKEALTRLARHGGG